MSEFKLEFSEIEWIHASKYARFKAFERDGKTIRILEFSLGFEESEWCEKAHTGFVVEGEIEIDFGKEKYPIEKATVFLFRLKQNIKRDL